MQLVADDFTRANAGTLGANWTKISTDVDPSIVSNTASSNTAGSNHSALYNGWTGGNDQYAQATVVTNGSSNDGGPICRAVTSAKTFYLAEINATDLVALGSSMTFTIYEVSAGSFISISSTTLVISANDVIRCEAQGSTIRGFVNGVQKVTGTNSVITSGKPGLDVWQGAAPTSTWDNWSAGDFSSGGTAPVRTRPFPFKPGSPRASNPPYR